MNKSLKRAQDTLEALDFRLDHEDRKLRTDRWVYTHGNAPEQRLVLNFRMSEVAASKVIRHAEAIVGLATTETDPTERETRAAVAKRREKARRDKEIAEAKARAEEKARRIQSMKDRQYVRRQMRDDLTVGDQIHVLRQIEGEWIDPARITDELCISEARVKEAIDSGDLDAYMCSGKRVRCKIADVTAWVKSRAKASA